MNPLSEIPAYAVLIGTGVILTYLPKVLSGAMESLGGARHFKRAAMATIGATITGGTSLAAGLAARGAGGAAATAAGRAAAAGNMTRAARLTRVASLSNQVGERSDNIARSSFRQLSNVFKDEAGLGGLARLPHDDIRFRTPVPPLSGSSTSSNEPREYRHGGPRGTRDGHLHYEVFRQGAEGLAGQAVKAGRIPAMSDSDAQRYVRAYKTKSIDLQRSPGQPARTDPRTPVSSPLGWKEATDKQNPRKRTTYYETPKVQADPSADQKAPKN